MGAGGLAFCTPLPGIAALMQDTDDPRAARVAAIATSCLERMYSPSSPSEPAYQYACGDQRACVPSAACSNAMRGCVSCMVAWGVFNGEAVDSA